MARRRYRRYSRRRNRWSPNILRIGPNSFNIAGQTRDFGVVTLIENQAYDPSRSNTIITVKNTELSIEFESQYVILESATAYILYIPEGYTASIDTPVQHPEWIMAYKFFGSPNVEIPTGADTATNTTKPIQRIRTKLSRRLNTGDRIILFVEAQNIGGTSQQLQFQGLCRWWTKAN